MLASQHSHLERGIQNGRETILVSPFLEDSERWSKLQKIVSLWLHKAQKRFTYIYIYKELNRCSIIIQMKSSIGITDLS